MQSDDRLDMMALFVRVADTGRLAEASRQLGISQPAASRMLRRLEGLLNVELVRRSTHGLRLTSAGQQFADVARAMLEQWRVAAESFDKDAANLSGPIKIFAPVAIGQNLLASIFAAFCRRHPGVSVECSLHGCTDGVLAQGYDLQVRIGPILHQSLVVREMWTVERTIVAAATHPAVLHPTDLAQHSAIRVMTSVPQTVEITHADGETCLLKQRSVFTSDNLYAVLTAVRDGLGYAILPVWATQRSIEAGELRRLCPGWRPPAGVVSLVYPPSPLQSKRLEALLAFLRNELTEDAGLGIAFLDAWGARDSVTTAPAPSRRAG